MKANAASVLAIFEKKIRLEVPLFQRAYVWVQERDWEPLWEDIVRKFNEYLAGRREAPVHFLGAMVLDQKQTPTTHVEKRYVIDGQQRLTTLQIFLAAFRDLCRVNECHELADECEPFILNKGMMANAEVDRFKVWPTQVDRTQFVDVITSGSREELEKRYPLVKRKYARKPDPRPLMVEAYIFFHDQLTQFLIGTPTETPIASDQPLAKRAEECFQALRSALQVVVIDLEKDDDAQVIFETLNSRGEPLLPADLLRNFIFLRAARKGDDQEALYEKYWRRFDDPFWREEVSQGRLNRPRSDLYMQHFLSSRQGIEVPIKHLFVEYKFWIETKKPFATVREEVAALAKQAEDFRRIIAPQRGDVLYELATFLDCFDIRTPYPLLLLLLDSGLTDDDWRDVGVKIESYLLRRAVCGLTTKNYNRVFLNMIRTLRSDGASSANTEGSLGNLTGESAEWPSDESFRNAWQGQNAYQTLGNAKLVHILQRLNNAYIGPLNEQISIEGPLTVEHILPQNWLDHWLLPDGSKGLTDMELWDTPEADPRGEATRRRNHLLHTIGNLTILTQPLNSSISNSTWRAKRPAMLNASLLPINHVLHAVEIWDEAAIEKRSRELFAKALGVWPRPNKNPSATGEHST